MTKLTTEDIKNIKDQYKSGTSIREISRIYGHKVSRATIQLTLFPKRRKKVNANNKEYMKKKRLSLNK